jgi:pyridoxal phosphate enzyme (YggS family)
LQGNADNESSKAGINYAELDELADACADLPGIRLRGLMAIPAPRTQFDAQRAAFARLRECLEKLQTRHTSMDTLSMGMSGDMEAAIAEGATIVRVGTAIFGSR